MSDTPQFGTAEYQAESGTNTCRTCGRTITSQYFRVSGAMTCPSCAEQTDAMLPKDSHGAYGRGILFGVIGALVGLTIYSAVGIITGLEIGYVSLLVGYVVGRAILMGSAGNGGRRYQIAAGLLTYAAISVSAVPIGLWQLAHEKTSTAAITEQAAVQPDDAATVAAEPPAEELQLGDAETVAAETPAGVSQPGLAAAIITLAIIGLISPFLAFSDPVSGLIGLVILFVGLSIAWRMTAGNGVEVSGPYTI